jgi:hypothetical protein
MAHPLGKLGSSIAACADRSRLLSDRNRVTGNRRAKLGERFSEACGSDSIRENTDRRVTK